MKNKKLVLTSFAILVGWGILFLLMMFNKINLYLFICSSIYTLLIGITFVMSDFYLLSPLFLFCIFYTKAIGYSPLFYTLSNGIYLKNVYHVIIIAYVLFLIGYRMVKDKKVQNSEKKINPNTEIVFAYLLIFISIIADIIFLKQNYMYFFAGQYESDRINAISQNGLLILLMDCGQIGLCMLFEKVLNKEFSKLKFGILALVVLPLTLIKGFRSALIVPIIIMVFMLNKKMSSESKRINNKKVILVGVLVLIALAIMGVARGNMSSLKNTVLLSIINMFKVGIYNLDAVLETFPNKLPFQHGYSYLINFIMLKPGPDLDFTLWLKEAVGYTFAGGGLTPSIIGEFYLNFGYTGVYIGMFLIGCVFKKVSSYYAKSNKLYYSSFILFCFLSICSGGISNIEINFIMYSIIYFGIEFIIKLRNR